MDGIIERLKAIGLNTYEAKVYLALLQQHPATGYEVSKISNVPQARAYDTLKSLEVQKMVVVTGGKPITYTPIPPEVILSRFESHYQGSIDYLRSALPTFAVESIEPVHNLRGQDAVVMHAKQMIEQAQSTIFIELWREHQDALEPVLREAVQRGVNVYVVGYNQVDYDFCTVYQHALADTIESSLGAQWLILAVDTSEGMIGTSPVGVSQPHAIWTRNPAIVLVIKELIVHDLFLLDVEHRLADEMSAAYGCNLLKIRNKILGDEILIGAH